MSFLLTPCVLGDIYLTNDPWKGTGHLFDVVVVTPVFHSGHVVALFACTSHVVDIGGVGFSSASREIYPRGTATTDHEICRR